jgi:hypothetical protein
MVGQLSKGRFGGASDVRSAHAMLTSKRSHGTVASGHVNRTQRTLCLQQRTFVSASCMLRQGSDTLLGSSSPASHVRFTPESRHSPTRLGCLLWANSGHHAIHSITASARASIAGGTVRPSILAVSVLMTNSKLVDCATGRSAGLAPLRMRPA